MQLHIKIPTMPKAFSVSCLVRDRIPASLRTPGMDAIWQIKSWLSNGTRSCKNGRPNPAIVRVPPEVACGVLLTRVETFSLLTTGRERISVQGAGLSVQGLYINIYLFIYIYTHTYKNIYTLYTVFIYKRKNTIFSIYLYVFNIHRRTV